MKPLKMQEQKNQKIFNGFLLVDKPSGMTSNDLCQILRKRYFVKSCGHVGTLDPDATGLMVLAFNRATKLLPYLNTDNKTYLTTITFGYLTDTLDLSGKILDETNNINIDKLNEALNILKNKKTQVPPKVSAIKVNGKKLYEYQRNNIEVEIKERLCHINNIEIVKNIYKEDNKYHIDLLLDVSKGYYIRSFARDLGELLDSYGAVKTLRRVKVGDFDISDSYTLNTILNEEISLIEITNLLKYDRINIKERILNFVLNGVTLYKRNLIEDSDAINNYNIDNLDRFILYYENEPISIYQKEGENYRPIFKF